MKLNGLIVEVTVRFSARDLHQLRKIFKREELLSWQKRARIKMLNRAVKPRVVEGWE